MNHLIFMKFRNLFLLFLFGGFLLSYTPSYGQDADNDCKNYCTDKEKFPNENYTSGRLRPDGGVGKCKDNEEVQDICCCLPGKH